jgi:hypothetical protein
MRNDKSDKRRLKALKRRAGRGGAGLQREWELSRIRNKEAEQRKERGGRESQWSVELIDNMAGARGAIIINKRRRRKRRMWWEACRWGENGIVSFWNWREVHKHYIEMGRTIRVQKRERTVCKYESSQRVTTWWEVSQAHEVRRNQSTS